MEYYELYKAIGIDLGNDYLESLPKSVSPSPSSSSDNNSNYEFWDWGDHVLRNQDNSERPFALDHCDEQNYQWKKIHRYVRKERFKSILTRLLNCRGNIPISILDFIKSELRKKRITRLNVWVNVRSILKTMGCRKYYNMIPQIIRHCTGLTFTKNPHNAFTHILNAFAYMDYAFDTKLKKKWCRSYFPNLRFVALTLLEMYGVKYDYHVPKLRTNRKLLILNQYMKEFIH